MKYAVADIHGNIEAWKSILEQINFSKDDELYVLGDVIDRNPYGIEILKEIMTTNNMHMLIGNHEYMMVDYFKTNDHRKLDLWYYNGGDITDKYLRKEKKSVIHDIIEYCDKLPLNIDIDDTEAKFVLCHANTEKIYNFYNDRGMINESKKYFCVWDRDHMVPSIEEPRFVIHGHTPTCMLYKATGFMCALKRDNSIDLDCGAAYGHKYGKPYGRLACLCLDNFRIKYSEG